MNKSPSIAYLVAAQEAARADLLANRCYTHPYYPVQTPEGILYATRSYNPTHDYHELTLLGHGQAYV